MIFGIPVKELILPVSIILGSLILGIFFEKFLWGKLENWAERNKKPALSLILRSLRGITILLLINIGLFLIIRYLNVEDDLRKIFSKISVVGIIILSTLITARTIASVISLQKEKRGVLRNTSIFMNLTKIIIYIIGVLIILSYLGISILPILTALGVGGIAIALALQGTFANLFSGLNILVARQIRTGQFVRIENGEEGYIKDINWRNTTIETIKKNYIILPNSKMDSVIVTNFDLPTSEMTVLCPVGVSYDSDLEFVENITIDVAKQTMQEVDGGVTDFDPLIRYNEFDDFSINFNVVLRVSEYGKQYSLISEFIKRLHKKYNEVGIVIPFPIRTIHMSEKK